MKNNSLIITAVTQRAALRPGVMLLLSVSSRVGNNLMQKLRAKFFQVTRKMPLNTLTHLPQNCCMAWLKKKPSPKSDRLGALPRELKLPARERCVEKQAVVFTFRFVSGKTDCYISSLSQQKPWKAEFLRPSGKASVAVLTFGLGVAACFCTSMLVVPWLCFGWVCIVEQKGKF